MSSEKYPYEMTDISGGPDDSRWDGNTTIVQSAKNYIMFIGRDFYNFNTEEWIPKETSKMGNINTAYPLANAQKHFQHLRQKKYEKHSRKNPKTNSRKRWLLWAIVTSLK